MRHRALIIESSRLFQGILKNIMTAVGVECVVFSSAKAALESKHGNYTFIIVSRTLSDLSGNIFLSLYSVEHGLGDALAILMVVSDDGGASLKKASTFGFQLVLDKKNLDEVENAVVSRLHNRAIIPPPNILLVEDSSAIAGMIVGLFENNGSNIKHVSYLSEMKKVFVEDEIDLVISDYYLNDDETGDDVISFIRNHESDDKCTTPILVVSSEGSQKKRVSLLQNGANDFIIKPYDNDELMVRSSNLIQSGKLLKQVRVQNNKLSQLALTDKLSGLYNRHSLYDLAPKYISNARRQKTPLVLMAIDLDAFKAINDTKGHIIGDIILRSVSAVLKEHCRTEDIVARLGGDEFVMLLANCTIKDGLDIGERLRFSIEQINAEGITVTSSIGVAALIESDEGFEDLFERADKAVYEAKNSGRNRVATIPHQD